MLYVASFLQLTHFAEQLVMVCSAFIICSLLGVERHFHQKNAGVKTHVLVGVGACVFTLVSAYGFGPVLGTDVHLDPSRIAAQIVSGIGFLGAGVIFVNNDTVRGLTTAATIWLSAALGVACGAGMIPLAIAVLVLHYIVIFLIGPVANRIPATHRNERVVIKYHPRVGTLRTIIMTATRLGYQSSVESSSTYQKNDKQVTRLVMQFNGHYPREELYTALAGIDGVTSLRVRNLQELD